MKIILYLVMLIGVCGSSAVAHAAAPLFADESVIKIRIDAPFKKLLRTSAKSTDPYEAQITLEDAQAETHNITLAARGNSRRTLDICKFPPLRVRFKEKPEGASFFKGQKSLKLVTHCSGKKKYQQYNFLEYSVYKIYNELTPQSLNVRLAQIDYVDSDNGKIYTTRYGFFIEDMDDAAKRNGMKELDLPSIKLSQLDQNTAARVALFNFMVGNIDFAMTKGPTGVGCCHNGKLMAATKGATENLIYVPYDFDQTGLVDTEYSAPPAPKFRIRTTRFRVYLGFCRFNEAVVSEAKYFLREKENIKAAVSNVSLMDEKSQKSTLTYLDDFFEILSDPIKMDRKILKACTK